MRRFKYAVAFLLCALILVGGALLPKGAAWLQDNATIGQVQSREMQADALETYNLTDFEKMDLLARESYSNIDDTMTTMNAQTVESAARLALVPYYNAGILYDLMSFTFTCAPRLYYPPTANSKGNIFWSVYMYNESAGCSIEMLVDDSTAHIFSITCNGNYRLWDQDLKDVAETLKKLFFKDLSIAIESAEYMEGYDWELSELYVCTGELTDQQAETNLDESIYSEWSSVVLWSSVSNTSFSMTVQPL